MTISLSHKQHGVLFGMGAAGLITLCVLLFAAFKMPNDLRPSTISEALRWFALLSFPLLICIATLAKHRFFSPEDIDGSGLTKGTEQAVVLQSILQNTLEQTVLASFAYIGFAAVSPPARLGVIPAAAVLFLVGRAAFAKGYASGAAHRAFGFALTFYPTVVLCVAAGLLFLVQLIKS